MPNYKSMSRSGNIIKINILLRLLFWSAGMAVAAVRQPLWGRTPATTWIQANRPKKYKLKLDLTYKIENWPEPNCYK